MLVRDLTGRLTTWIEVGAPDAERLHYASKLADRATVAASSLERWSSVA